MNELAKDLMLPPQYFIAFNVLLIIAIVIILLLKGLALWRSARKGQTVWFWVLLFVNTLGILEIIYLLISKEKAEAIDSVEELDKVVKEEIKEIKEEIKEIKEEKVEEKVEEPVVVEKVEEKIEDKPVEELKTEDVSSNEVTEEVKVEDHSSHEASNSAEATKDKPNDKKTE